MLGNLSKLSEQKRALLQKLREKEGLTAQPAQRINRYPRGETMPIALIQQSLWLFDQIETDKAVYNMPFVLRLRGQLDISALTSALNDIVMRHEILRTNIVYVAGKPRLIIADEMPVALPVTDLREQSLTENALSEVIKRIVQQPISLEKDALMQVTLLQVAADEFVLVLNLHHIIADGASINLLYRELVLLYNAAKTGESFPLKPLSIQYADYAQWQQEKAVEEGYANQLDYWRQQLAGKLPVLALPTKSAQASQSFKGASQQTGLTHQLSHALRTLGEAQKSTLFTTMLSAFNILVHRYTDESDILIGTPVSTRNQPQLQSLIGLFINTVILRTQIESSTPFVDVLKTVRQATFDAFANQDVPFDQVVSELDRNPLQLFFSIQNASEEQEATEETFAGLDVATEHVEMDQAKFELSLKVIDDGSTIQLEWEYNTDLFEAATIQRISAQFEQLLQTIVAQPQQAIGALSLLSEGEAQQILQEWNATESAYPLVTLSDLITQQTEQTPLRISAEFLNQSLTYQDLNERVNQLAHHLQTLGVTPNSFVGVHVNRSLEMLIAVLAVLKSGGAYVPLDPAFPSDRIAYMLEDAQIEILLTDSPLSVGDFTIVDLIAAQEMLKSYPVEEPQSNATPSDLAYVIYTSGSTGKPKGVQITHQTLVNFLCSMQKTPGFTADDTLLAVTTLSFDIAALELYLPLISGGKVVIVTDEIAHDGLRLADYITESQSTVLQATPATWQMLLAADWQGDETLTILSGGEALHSELATQLLQRGKAVWNMYGPTETTIWSSVYAVTQDRLKEGVVSIGSPIANTQFYILDDYGSPVPIGVPGTLFIAGEGLARGYLNRPKLTTERFIPDPFSSEVDARMYNTGDLARYLPDGNVVYLGRKDHQVKIRGYRIELGEIEAQLCQHPAIQSAVVYPQKDNLGHPQLVAYLISSDDVTSTELRALLQASLPQYMIPVYYIFLDQFPLTPNQKVNRRALPLPEENSLSDSAEYVAPQNLLQIELRQIWETIMGIQPIGIKHNFFDLGGHSFLAVQIVHQIGERTGRKIPVSTIFQYPTIETLATYLQNVDVSDLNTTLVPIHTKGDRAPLFCFHPLSGTISAYVEIARHLDDDQPVYGLQYIRESDELADNSVIALATRYRQEIQKLRPHGPYHLLGWSFGGTLAYETGLQLTRLGEEVAFLGLLDVRAPVRKEIPTQLDNSVLLAQIVNEMGRTLQKDILISADELHRLPEEQRHDYVLNALHKSGMLEANATIDNLYEHLNLIKQNIYALETYDLEPYSGLITLFRARDPNPDSEPLRDYFGAQYDTPHYGWNDVTIQPIEIHEVPGEHVTIGVEPNVQTLAQIMMDCLKKSTQ